MSWHATCPQCSVGFDGDESFACPNHGEITPLWRPERADYESFAQLVQLADEMATYVPWPMSPGWQISDFGTVADRGTDSNRTYATFTTTTGTSDMDGHVEVTLVAEEPGVGLGARCAHTSYVDPGDQIDNGPPLVHVRAGGSRVPLWPVDTNHNAPLSASVFTGEADGRWLWVIMRPASSALLLRDEWLLADVTGFGPEAIEIPFGGPRANW